MRRLLPLVALLFVGGCDPSSGDRGAPADTATLSKPMTPEAMQEMPPQARAAAQASMERGAAMKAQYDKMYGGK